ncbi:MAG: hypothetical protein AAF413_01275 [Patescibacteria group bacterium]
MKIFKLDGKTMQVVEFMHDGGQPLRGRKRRLEGLGKHGLWQTVLDLGASKICPGDYLRELAFDSVATESMGSTILGILPPAEPQQKSGFQYPVETGEKRGREAKDAFLGAALVLCEVDDEDYCGLEAQALVFAPDSWTAPGQETTPATWPTGALLMKGFIGSVLDIIASKATASEANLTLRFPVLDGSVELGDDTFGYLLGKGFKGIEDEMPPYIYRTFQPTPEKLDG